MSPLILEDLSSDFIVTATGFLCRFADVKVSLPIHHHSADYLVSGPLGWMNCDLKSFLTVFQSNHNERRVVMKGLCNETPFTIGNVSASGGARNRDR